MNKANNLSGLRRFLQCHQKLPQNSPKKKKKKLRLPNPLENRFYPGLRRNLGLSEKYFHKPLLFRWKLNY